MKNSDLTRFEKVASKEFEKNWNLHEINKTIGLLYFSIQVIVKSSFSKNYTFSEKKIFLMQNSNKIPFRCFILSVIYHSNSIQYLRIHFFPLNQILFHRKNDNYS